MRKSRTYSLLKGIVQPNANVYMSFTSIVFFTILHDNSDQFSLTY